MATNPLTSLSDYSRFVAELFSQPNVKSSTVAVWSDSPYTGIAEGEVLFTNGLRLRTGGPDEVGNRKTLVPDSDKWGARFEELVQLTGLLER